RHTQPRHPGRDRRSDPDAVVRGTRSRLSTRRDPAERALDTSECGWDDVMQWTLLIQTLIIGLATGSLIALIALGYTLVYGIIELINFAHGEVFMMGAMFSATVVGWFSVTRDSSTGAIVGVLVVA